MDRYHLIRELGRGAMGAVYRAVQVGLQRDVALKLINPELAQEPLLVERFHREARTLAKLNHPGVVQVFDEGVQDGQLFYAMELLEGRDLWQIVQDQGGLPMGQLAAVAAQVADALAYVHEHGLVHRDVKPANLILEAGGRVVLTDFGLVTDPTGVQLTRQGSDVGTPRFMAPENVMLESSGSPRDLWALGVTIHELATGQPSRNADNIKDVLRQILSDPPPDLSLAGVQAPPWLLDLQKRLLERDPAKRPTAREVATLLAERVDRAARQELDSTYFNTLPPKPRKAPRKPSLAVRPPPPPRSPAGAIALALIGAGALAFTLFRPAPLPPPARPVFDGEPRPAGHRALVVPLAEGVSGTLEALDGDAVVARGTIEGRTARLTGLPAARALTLRAAGATRAVTTPAVIAVERFICWASERDIVVDFELERPTAVTVELQRRDGTVVESVPFAEGTTAVHRVFRPLPPATGYTLRVRRPSGWGGLAAYDVDTAPAKREREVQIFFDQLSDPQLMGWATLMFDGPDLRLEPAFRRALGTVQPTDVAALRRLARGLAPLRDPALAGLLAPFVPRLPVEAGESRGALIRALSEARHPAALPLARTFIERAEDTHEALVCAEVLSRAREVGPVLAIAERSPTTTGLAALAARADPGRTAATCAGWLARGGPLAVAGVQGLEAALAEGDANASRIAAGALAGALAREAPVARAAADALARGGAGGAALAAAFRARPDATLLWAVARAGALEAAPDVAAVAGRAGPLQADAVCALALFGGPVEPIEAAFRGRDEAVSVAAAWALERLGRTSAEVRERLAAGVAGRPLPDAGLATRVRTLLSAGQARLLAPVSRWERTGWWLAPGDTLTAVAEPIAEGAGAQPAASLWIGAQEHRLVRGRQSLVVTGRGELLIEQPRGARRPFRLELTRGE